MSHKNPCAGYDVPFKGTHLIQSLSLGESIRHSPTISGCGCQETGKSSMALPVMRLQLHYSAKLFLCSLEGEIGLHGNNVVVALYLRTM